MNSIEWYEKQIYNLLIKFENKEISIGEYAVTRVDLFKQAEMMHKKEIEKSYADGSNDRLRNIINDHYYSDIYGHSDSKIKSEN